MSNYRQARAWGPPRGDKSFDALVAGAVGPLGVRIEKPLGKIPSQKPRRFRQQTAALKRRRRRFADSGNLRLSGGTASGHSRCARVNSEKLPPIVAQVTIDEDGNCLDGSSPEHYGPQMEAWGADVIGCNCSVGPVAMLDALERVAPSPLRRFPRNRTPEFRARGGPQHLSLFAGVYGDYMEPLVNVGVRLIGGCCGTTPEHIHTMKLFLKVGAARASSYKVAKTTETKPVIPAFARAFGPRSFADGEFGHVEIVPPRGIDARRELEARSS